MCNLYIKCALTVTVHCEVVSLSGSRSVNGDSACRKPSVVSQLALV